MSQQISLPLGITLLQVQEPFEVLKNLGSEREAGWGPDYWYFLVLTNCQIFPLKSWKQQFGMKGTPQKQPTNTDDSHYFGVQTGPLFLPGPLYKFSWVVKDNEAVALDWGRENMVTLYHPFMLPTTNMATLPACYLKPRVGKQEHRNPVIAELTAATFTPLPIGKHV